MKVIHNLIYNLVFVIVTIFYLKSTWTLSPKAKVIAEERHMNIISNMQKNSHIHLKI